MEKVLAKMTGNVFSGILFGALVTAAVQSSSATTVIVVGLVNAGLLKLKGAVGIIMGANIGTTMTTQILMAHKPRGRQQRPCYIAALQAVEFLVYTYRYRSYNYNGGQEEQDKERGRDNDGHRYPLYRNDTYAGEDRSAGRASAVRAAFAVLKNPVLGVLVGAIFTAIIQSSAASIGILQALSVSGAITFAFCISYHNGN